MRLMAAASAVALIWRHPVADIAAREAAPLGAGFTLLCLVTGSLWGEPMWGTWWVWDARLTSVLVLFFLYLGYIALVNAFDDPTRGAAPARSSRWSAWSICRSSNSRSIGGTRCISRRASSASAARPSPRRCCGRSLIMALGFTLFFVTLWLLRIAQRALMAAKLRALARSRRARRHEMEALDQFLAMGGYARFVWPAYARRR